MLEHGQPTPAAPRRPVSLPEADAVRHVVFVGAVTLLLASIGLSIVFYTTSYQRVLALGRFVYHDEGFSRLGLPLTPTRYGWLRGILAGGTGIGLLLLVGLRRAGQSATRLWTDLWAELRLGSVHLVRWWSRLPVSARLLAAGLVAVLVAVRGWYMLYYPLGTDEVASYDYFVREGPVAITSYYPIPNNHIFYNLLAWPLAEAGLSPRLVMRLPTLLLGTMGTVAGYTLLARRTGLRLATLVVGLVGLAPLWVYYAAVGRGYFGQFCLLQVGFFTVTELLRPVTTYWRLSWLAFIGSSILGLYTIPTYAYPLASLAAGLGTGLLAQRRWPAVRALLVAGAVIVVITLLLYAPVVTVSGWAQLTANRYVAAKTAVQFWPAYRAVLYETAAELFGPSLRLSGPAWLGTALLGALAVRRWLPAGSTRCMGLLAWVLLALPLLLMAAQRVYAPVRVLLYLTFFGYLLGALLLVRLPFRRWLAARWRWPLVMTLVMGVAAPRLYYHQAQVRASRAETQQLQQAYYWLRARPRPPTSAPAQVWLCAPLHELFFAHYARQDAGADTSPDLMLHSGGRAGPRRPYDFVVLDNYFTATARLVQAHYHAVYHDRLVTIYSANP